MKKLARMMLAVAALAIGAQAETIYVDFSDHHTHPSGHQTTPVDRYWNTPTFNGNLTDMVNEHNNATTVDLTVLDDFFANHNAGKTSSGLVNWGDPVTQDNWYIHDKDSPNDFAQIRLEDLQVGGHYDLTFYGARGLPGYTRIMTVTIDGGPQTYNAGHEGMTTFEYVTADNDGYITIDFSTPVSRYTHLNGMEINLVPEPGSLCLLGIGLLGLAVLHGRRRRVGGTLGAELE